MPDNLQIRMWQSADVARLHDINEAAVPGVGTLGREPFEDLVANTSDVTFVALLDGRIEGFVMGLIEGRDYASLNYQWLSERYKDFAYVDRIAVAASARGLRIGAALYSAMVSHYEGRRDILLAEVNLAPPNPGSLRFHQRHGFVRVGERWDDKGGKGVVYLARNLAVRSIP